MNSESDFLNAVRRGYRLVPAPLIMECQFCHIHLAPEYRGNFNRYVYKHREMEEFQLTWEYLTADNFCPNNAKIWILEPDMVTLREI